MVALVVQDFNTLSMHEGSIMEAKGIIKGKGCTYYIIKPLHGGAQSSCYLVSKKKGDEDCCFVAKVRIPALYLEINFFRTRSRHLVPMNVKR